jgi:peptidoglycan/xylan/chitin deacetylase (PgdA/CDA1 family)
LRSTARSAEAIRASRKAALDAGWEFMGHGFVQRPMHHVEDQRAAIRDTIAAIREFTGKAPRGWESPGLTETDVTADLLAEAGSSTSPTGCSTTSRA